MKKKTEIIKYKNKKYYKLVIKNKQIKYKIDKETKYIRLLI